MTLVVGLKTQKRVQLLSDTRITHPDVTQIEELPGRLKLVTISPSVCVGYAGPTNRAMDSIRALARTGASFLEAVEALRTVSANGDVDFLAAQSLPSLDLWKIQRGRAASVNGTVWIGDGEAATEYEQRAITARQLPHTDDPELGIISSLGSAFNALVRERAIESVGGLPIRVSSRLDGFHYPEQALAYYPAQTIPPGVSTTLTFGGPAEGGFAYSLLVPDQPGVPIIGVHFVQGRLGYVYVPLEQDKPVEVPEVTHSQLREYVRAHYRSNVDGVHVG
jgi:hypothetical protein